MAKGRIALPSASATFQQSPTPLTVTSATRILAIPAPMIELVGPAAVSMLSVGKMISSTCEFGTGRPSSSMTIGRGTI